MSNWPLVDKNDDGIRPAGKPDECFYCNQKVGQEHAADCVIVHKRVKLRYIFELEVEVPYFWTPENIEDFKENSCNDNAVNDLVCYMDALNEKDQCLCCIPDSLKVEFIEIVDDTPRRELKTDPATPAPDAP